MSVFAVLSEEYNPKLEVLITEKYPKDHYKITSTQWLVYSKETTKQLTDTLGITSEGGKKKGDTGSAIVLAISSYWGIANTDMWGWMKVKMEEGSG
jgi:hypothetical protein